MKKIKKIWGALLFLIIFPIMCFDLNSSTFNNYKTLSNKPITYDLKVSGSVNFTYIPLETDAYVGIIPLGNLNPGGHTLPTDHIYFELNESSSDKWDIKAPASGVIYKILYVNETHNGPAHDDYMIKIRHTDTFYSWIGHAANLSGPLTKYLGNLEEGEWTYIDEPIDAGEILGQVWVRGFSYCLDWSLLNYEQELPFIHPNTYVDNTRYADCPFKYLNEALADEIKAKCRRVGNPWYGKVCYDVNDTVSGNWFLETNRNRTDFSDSEKSISLAYYQYNSTQLSVSIGANITGKCPMGVYNTTGENWSDIRQEDGKVTYHLVHDDGFEIFNYTMIIQLETSERLKIETFNDHLTDPSFTENATYFNRIGFYYNRNIPITLISMILNIITQSSSSSNLILIGTSIAIGGSIVLIIILAIIIKKKS